MGWMAEDTIRKFVNSIHFKEQFYFSQITDEELADLYKKLMYY